MSSKSIELEYSVCYESILYSYKHMNNFSMYYDVFYAVFSGLISKINITNNNIYIYMKDDKNYNIKYRVIPYTLKNVKFIYSCIK